MSELHQKWSELPAVKKRYVPFLVELKQNLAVLILLELFTIIDDSYLVKILKAWDAYNMHYQRLISSQYVSFYSGSNS